MKLSMTIDEIKRSYKQAGDKKKQIGILADLNAVPRSFIMTVLRENGITDLPRIRSTHAELAVMAENPKPVIETQKDKTDMTKQGVRQYEKEQKDAGNDVKQEAQKNEAETVKTVTIHSLTKPPRTIPAQDFMKHLNGEQIVENLLKKKDDAREKQGTKIDIPHAVAFAIIEQMKVCDNTIRLMQKRKAELQVFCENNGIDYSEVAEWKPNS